MNNDNALAVYKNKPVLVKEKSQDKITVCLPDGSSIKVREKDIEIIHPGPVKKGIGEIINGIRDRGSGIRDSNSDISDASGLYSGTSDTNPHSPFPSPQSLSYPHSPFPIPHSLSIKETWELLSAEGEAVSLKELAELAFDEYSPESAWAAYQLLTDGLYFTGTVSAILPRPQEQVEADIKKREEKQKASGEREEFLQRLRKRQPHLTDNSEQFTVNKGHERNDQSTLLIAHCSFADDRHFIQDVEALALGKSEKSRTMKDIGLGETPEEAHSLLLECGFWTITDNPHPARFGVNFLPAKHVPERPSYDNANRQDLTGMAAFAIDSPWSHDPDDAVSLEIEDGRQNLYVHVADPAAAIGADSQAEREARDRGATLYIPEGPVRMLAENALPVFALGLAETSPALTFKMTLTANGEIEETEIFPSVVKVSRLTYEEADRMIDGPDSALSNLYALAERNFYRRTASGAVTIDLPETHIKLKKGLVTIEPVVPYRSADMVRECMLLAGEGAGIWAARRKLPVPFAGQETGDIPDETLPGPAGAYQLRRCMRPRTLSVSPSRHYGLGLETYVQVTSPLRRYTDLLAHIQIRSLLRGGTPLSADEVSQRMSAGDAAAAAVAQAERASRSHWTAVYLSTKKDSVWDAIVLEKKGNRHVVIVPALALETQVSVRRDIAPNEPLKVILKSVNIPKGEAVFVAEE